MPFDDTTPDPPESVNGAPNATAPTQTKETPPTVADVARQQASERTGVASPIMGAQFQSELEGYLIFFITFLGVLVVSVATMALGIASEQVYLIVFTAGAVFGAFGYMVFWGTIGPNRPWPRWILGFVGSFIGFNALLLVTTAFDSTSPDIDQLFRLNLAGPLVFMAAQGPLWLARIALGWRVRRVNTMGPPQERRFGILEIMLTMAYMGVAISLTRFAVPERDQGMQEAAMIALVAAIYSAMWIVMFAVPTTMGVLLPNHTFGTAAATIGYFLIWLILPVSAGWILTGSFPLEAALGIIVYGAGSTVTFVIPLVVLKARGYVLEVRIGTQSNIAESPFAVATSPFAADFAAGEAWSDDLLAKKPANAEKPAEAPSPDSPTGSDTERDA